MTDRAHRFFGFASFILRASLTDIEAIILFHYYFLGKNLSEIGADYNCSRENIRQHRQAGLRKVHAYYKRRRIMTGEKDFLINNMTKFCR